MSVADRYRLSRLSVFFHRAIGTLPPFWREKVAERFLRRSGTPAPAAEHVAQYLLSAAKSAHRGGQTNKATVAEGADIFYQRQYRQALNPTMGAFAMTATQALLAAGGEPKGWMWGRRRTTSAALIEQLDSAAPILVIDPRTVAVPLWLPEPAGETELKAAKSWWSGRGPMPSSYRNLIQGTAVKCCDASVKAFEREAAGATLEVIGSLLENPRLALLALHPHDPDAMGLHITLYGVELVDAEKLRHDHGLRHEALAVYQDAARRNGRALLFAVGGSEEVFTQCSQNLFSKRPAPAEQRVAAMAQKWAPSQPLEDLIRAQFELFQTTVSSAGLPGASPRNGDKGKAAYVCRRKNKLFLLIPYHPGNFIHGHAAKLWSNPFGTLVVSDDHHSLSRVMIAGSCRTMTHGRVKMDFPEAAAEVASQIGRTGKPIPDPEYWFVQHVSQLMLQREPLKMNMLEPGRETCTISAGGQSRHGKKPAYFAADNLPAYDMGLQHEREAAGRPLDPSGASSHEWQAQVGDALTARLEHLRRVAGMQ